MEQYIPLFEEYKENIDRIQEEMRLDYERWFEDCDWQYDENLNKEITNILDSDSKDGLGNLTQVSYAAKDLKSDASYAKLYGGKNGNGNWIEYLQTILDFIKRLNDNGFDCTIVYIENDCADDIYSMLIELHNKNIE